MKPAIFAFYVLMPAFLVAQNPITPPGFYLADPSGHVFEGKLYVYGSNDESRDYWCSFDHHFMSTSNLKNWETHWNSFSTKGENDKVPYNDNLLWAPDVAYKNGMYYLYYCQPGPQAEGVAVSKNPGGPFTNARELNTHGYNEIDPAVFIDEDGTVYYTWGQFSAKMARLKPGMTEIDPLTIREGIVTEADHFFHEGGFITKRNDLYYYIYAHMGRKSIPSCIAYATSHSPFGPYTYKGVIIDNDGCDPANWNNHGSIVEYKGQWYVLYHRTTGGSQSLRKACIEPIFFNPDGTINEVEMTSQGAAGPLNAYEEIDAARACLLQGNIRIDTIGYRNDGLTAIRSGDRVAFKYIDFGAGADSIVVRIRKGSVEGGFEVKAVQPWNRQSGIVHVQTSAGVEGQWTEIKAKVNGLKGVQALWFLFYTKNNEDKADFIIDSFRFIPIND